MPDADTNPPWPVMKGTAHWSPVLTQKIRSPSATECWPPKVIVCATPSKTHTTWAWSSSGWPGAAVMRIEGGGGGGGEGGGGEGGGGGGEGGDEGGGLGGGEGGGGCGGGRGGGGGGS